MVKFKKIVAVAGMIAVLAPSAAFAQSGVDGYSGDNNVVAALEDTSGNGGGGNSTAPQSVDDSGSSLPFTGADLGVLAGAGGLLLALGFGLRRLTYRPTAS
jgi:hypothetical protein